MNSKKEFILPTLTPWIFPPLIRTHPVRPDSDVGPDRPGVPGLRRPEVAAQRRPRVSFLALHQLPQQEQLQQVQGGPVNKWKIVQAGKKWPSGDGATFAVGRCFSRKVHLHWTICKVPTLTSLLMVNRRDAPRAQWMPPSGHRARRATAGPVIMKADPAQPRQSLYGDHSTCNDEKKLRFVIWTTERKIPTLTHPLWYWTLSIISDSTP